MDDVETLLLDALRSGGGRVTTPRRLIVRAFLDSGGHVTVEELAAQVQRADPDIALSTVYRTMETLEEAGVVEHLHLGHGPSVFHRADERHHHLVCEHCDTVVEMPDDVVEGFARAVEDAYGFLIDARHFAIPGRCATCAATSPAVTQGAVSP